MFSVAEKAQHVPGLRSQLKAQQIGVGCTTNLPRLGPSQV
jgi:hypothetical protein